MCVTASARQEALEQTCSTLQADNTSLSQHLEEAKAELEEHRERETQLSSMQTSLRARMYMHVHTIQIVDVHCTFMPINTCIHTKQDKWRHSRETANFKEKKLNCSEWDSNSGFHDQCSTQYSMYTMKPSTHVYTCLFDPGIDAAVMEERRKSRHELGEAHSLLEVARREQSKTALQLQQAERRVGHTRGRGGEGEWT